jgi:transcriptional regulator with XRE-family HTH domain
MSKRQHETLGEYIRAHREAAGLSQRQLAIKAGLYHSLLGRLESGDIAVRPTPEHLQKIADALSVDVSELLQYLGIKPTLPEPRVYFRRKLGVNAETADVLAQLVEEYQAKQRKHGKGEER